MWFVSKKKYKALEKQCEEWKRIADKSLASAEKFEKQASNWEKTALDLHEFNKRLVAQEEEMLNTIKQLETEKANRGDK